MTNEPISKSVPEGCLLWLSSAAGDAEFFSPSWNAFSGRTNEQLLGLGWYSDVHGDDEASLLVAIDKAIAKQANFRLKLRLRRSDGEYVPFACEGIVRIGSDGRFAGLIGVCTDITRDERESTEAELAGRHFADLLPQTELVALAVDESGRVIFFNKVLTRLLGVPANEVGDAEILERFLDRQHHSLFDVLFPGGKRVEKLPSRIESEFILGRDSKHVFLWYPIPLRDYAGKLTGVILIGDDMTEPRLAEEKLRLTARVFEATDLAMLITDSQGTILSANGAFSRLTGYSREEAIGSNPRVLQSGRHDHAFYKKMWDALLGEGRWQGEIWDKRKDGSVYPKFLSIHTLRNEHGQVTHYSGIFYDISERKAAEERLNRLAHFDSLTELPNRMFFQDKLSLACRTTVTNKERFALLYLDLDRFKVINDTLGHQAGDELLRETSHRLRGAIRSQDIAARIGGDEFVVLLSDVKDPANAVMVIKKIIESFKEPVTIGGQAVNVSLSIGVALCPDHAGDPDTLLRIADEAMYQAKAAGRNGYCFHST